MSQNDSAAMGMNKTGIATAPLMSKEMIESSDQTGLLVDGAVTAEDIRMPYMERRSKIGSVPPPLSIKGMASTALEALKGQKASVLVDKLAERLAFERSGARLYEALILKCRASEGAENTGARERLEHIRGEELEHFHMLWECIEKLGADPTVQTPSADVAAVISRGIPQVLLDPRTTFGQCLEAIMTAELVDADAWERLTELAEGFKQTEMAEKFRLALEQEKQHQIIIREFLSQEVAGEAGVAVH